MATEGIMKAKSMIKAESIASTMVLTFQVLYMHVVSS